MGDASLLIASSSSIVLAIWTELDANHTRLLTDVAAKLDGEIGTYAEGSATLPDGLCCEGKGGADAVMSMLSAALEERVTGHLKAGASDKAVSLALNNGLPVAMAANGQSFEEPCKVSQKASASSSCIDLHQVRWFHRQQAMFLNLRSSSLLSRYQRFEPVQKSVVNP